MYKEEKVYVPKDEKLRAEIIRLHCKGTSRVVLSKF